MSTGRALLYGLANLGYTLSYSTFNTYVLFFYADHLRAPAAAIGLAWLLFGLWNTVNDVLSGWVSDRIPARLGRRTLLIRWLALPAGAAAFLVWSPPGAVRAGGEGPLFWYFLAAAGAYDLFLTAINTSQAAAFPELLPEEASRARVSAIRQGMALAGIAAGVAAAPLVYDRLGWAAMGAIWGALLAALYLAALAGMVSESRTDPPGLRAVGFWAAVAPLLVSVPFLLYLLIQLASRIALGYLQAALPFYMKYTLGGSAGMLSAALGAMLAAAAVTFPLWPPVVRRLGLRRTGALLFFYSALAGAAFAFVRGPSGMLVAAAAIGPAFGGISVVLELLFGRVVDAELARSGVRRGGIISGLTGTALRLAPAAAGVFLASRLDAAGFDPALAAQPESVAAALRFWMAALPGAALAVTGLLLLRFPAAGPSPRGPAAGRPDPAASR